MFLFFLILLIANNLVPCLARGPPAINVATTNTQTAVQQAPVVAEQRAPPTTSTFNSGASTQNDWGSNPSSAGFPAGSGSFSSPNPSDDDNRWGSEGFGPRGDDFVGPPPDRWGPLPPMGWHHHRHHHHHHPWGRPWGFGPPPPPPPMPPPFGWVL